MSKVAKRREARGKECMVRLPGICNYDPETTVLAHYRLAGYCGMGLKPDDDLGAWCCSSCHDAIDSRVHIEGYDYNTIRRMHAEGVMRTWMARKG